MLIAQIIGRATSTVKHPSLTGWRLLIAQPLDAQRNADGSPQLVLDQLGAGKGDLVILSSDGKATREWVGADDSPARWAVTGILD